MASFDLPISRYMTTALAAVGLDTRLDEVARKLDERGISAVPVVEESGAMVGVISRSDLVHAGRLQAPSRRGAPVLVLPPLRAADLVQRAPLVVPRTTSLREAARLMRQQHVHRVFVTFDRRPLGVLSTADLCRAVIDAHVDLPIADIMSAPLITVRAEQPVSVAIERLDRAHITGVIVVDHEDWPVGVFSQIEALHARDLPRDTPVDDLLDPSIVCMPVDTPSRLAAEMIGRQDVRRVIASHERDAVGVVTGLDIAKIVAGDWTTFDADHGSVRWC